MSHKRPSAPAPSRRGFLKAAAVAVAAPMVVKSSVLGADGSPPPSERLSFALVGPGKQGTQHLNALVRRSDVMVRAVVDVQEEKRKAARETIERVVGSGKKDGPAVADPNALSTANDPWAATNLSAGAAKGPATKADDVKYYGDFREVLGRPDIDCVLIAVPDHWHALMVMEAARAGKDIYCEKPLTLTLGEARQVIDVVKRYDRVFQTGSQQRSSREFRVACELVRNGRIGQLKAIEVVTGVTSIECDLPAEPVRKGVDWEMWLGPAPYRPFSKTLCPPIEDNSWAMWRLYRDYSGGAMTDFGAHHFDIAQWGAGADGTTPVEVLPADGKERPHMTYRYANGVEIRHVNTGQPFGGKGLTFIGSEGRIDVDRNKLETTPADVRKSVIKPSEVHLYRSPGHHEDFIRAVRARGTTICPVEVGAMSVSVCHLGNICYWLNRPLKWDPQKWEFVGDEEANRWVHRPKRAPWYL